MERREEDSRQDRAARRLTMITIAGSALLALALLAIYLGFHSQLALAQAADSLFDTIGGGGLLWAIYASLQPADREHPQGHAAAQSVAALVVAVLAGVLAAEVLRSAVAALFGSTKPALEWPVAVVFATKVAFKSAIVLFAGQLLKRQRNAALSALRVDARNDVLVGSLALLGFLFDRLGIPHVDALLAIGLSLYIAYAGLRLGLDNASLLLGESASSERQQQLLAQALLVPGVRAAPTVQAVWRGARLHVQLSIAVDADLPLRAAHDIGHAVEKQLLSAPDVSQVSVHVEPVGASA